MYMYHIYITTFIIAESKCQLPMLAGQVSLMLPNFSQTHCLGDMVSLLWSAICFIHSNESLLERYLDISRAGYKMATE
jgi:hypothetical protein